MTAIGVAHEVWCDYCNTCTNPGVMHNALSLLTLHMTAQFTRCEHPFCTGCLFYQVTIHCFTNHDMPQFRALTPYVHYHVAVCFTEIGPAQVARFTNTNAAMVHEPD